MVASIPGAMNLQHVIELSLKIKKGEVVVCVNAVNTPGKGEYGKLERCLPHFMASMIWLVTAMSGSTIGTVQTTKAVVRVAWA